MNAGEKALEVAQQRDERGLTDYLNVADAQHRLFDLRGPYLQVRQQRAESFVKLCQALGGGWEPYQSLPPIRRAEPAIVAEFHRMLQSVERGNIPAGAGG